MVLCAQFLASILHFAPEQRPKEMGSQDYCVMVRGLVLPRALDRPEWVAVLRPRIRFQEQGLSFGVRCVGALGGSAVHIRFRCGRGCAGKLVGAPVGVVTYMQSAMIFVSVVLCAIGFSNAERSLLTRLLRSFEWW